MKNYCFQLINKDVILTDNSEISEEDITDAYIIAKTYIGKENYKGMVELLNTNFKGNFELLTPIKLDI
jgi:hypothetical protein